MIISKNKILFGLGWTSLSTIISGITQILRLSILARFLEKEDFGIVAILTFILGLTQVFSDMGFSAAIMSEKQLSKDRFFSLYWLQFIVFNLFILLVCVISPLISNYYKIASLKFLIPLMLSELFFVSIGKLYDTVLQKNLEFRILSLRNIISAIFSLFVAIILAWLECGVLSLVISTLVQSAVVNIWNFIAGQKKYKICFQMIDFKRASDLVQVGLYQMGTQLVDYVASKLDILVISSFLGVGALGIYNLAKELVLRFVMVVNTITTRVMLPVFSSKSDDKVQIKKMFISFVSKLSYLNTPIVGFVFVFAPFIVKILYGPEYEEANQVVSIMSIWSLFVVLGQPSGMIAIVLKRTDLSFSYTIVRFLLMAIMLFSFARTSLIVAALTMLFTYMIMFFVNWYMLLYRIISIGFFEYIHIFIKSWIGVILTSLIVLFIHRFSIIDNELINVLLEMFVFLFSLFLYVVVVERQSLNSFLRKEYQ